jgi:flavin reductase (DIM6/NTAB) family NADH-FMN oxidoreductase RutF
MMIIQGNSMRTFKPEELAPSQRHHYLLGTVNPRPICFASTLSKEGQPNLAPYSFFNIFSSTPPVFVFSVSNRRDGSQKDTLINARDTGEVVINLVNFNIARQMAICGVEYKSDINEFEKGGFTPVPSEVVKPFRVSESPVQFECRVIEIKSLSVGPGGANLIIAQALLMHMDEQIFSPEDHIDPVKLDMVGRLGNFNYCHVHAGSIFSIKQPPAELALGFDNLPSWVRESNILTGNQLAMLAGVVSLPSDNNLTDYYDKPGTRELLNQIDEWMAVENFLPIHQHISHLINQGNTREAWMLIMILNPRFHG